MKRILIVDDDATNRYFLKALLGGTGYEVIEAEDGRMALQRARESPPDLIVSDILMPNVDGFALIKAWKNDDVLRSIPFVFYTATYTEPEDEALGLRLGADRFLMKPMEPPDLLAALEDVLDREPAGLPSKSQASRRESSTQTKELHIDRVAGKLAKKVRELEREIERRQGVEEALRDREELYRGVFLSTSEGLLVFDAEGRIIEANPAASTIFGDPRDRLLRRSGHELLKTGPESLFQRLIEGEPGDVVTLSGRTRRGDGSWVPYVLRGGAIDLAQRRCYLAVVLDRSEESRLQDRLLHSQKTDVIGRLSGGIAHDFNNLLHVIMGKTGLTLERLPPGEANDKAREELTEVLEVADRTMGLTQRLLQLSQRRTPERKTFDVDTFLQGLEPLLRWMLGRSVVLDVVLDASGSAVMADRVQLEQIFLNLCVNSREAMPRGGTVTLCSRRMRHPSDTSDLVVDLREGTYVRLDVDDTGHGMTAETSQHATEPFFSTKETGSGLGLATVRDIVEGHGGAITWSSREGVGTCFSVLLPVVT